MKTSIYLGSALLGLSLALSLANAADSKDKRKGPPPLLPPRSAPAATKEKEPESGASKLLLSVDFESTPVGEIPEGFTKTGAVSVTDETAHSGKKSLKMEPAEKGARKITKQGPEIAALGGQHWGRLYLKVKLPIPVPTIPEGKKFAVIHSTMVEGTASSPLFSDPILVRLFGTCTGPKGTSQYLYNVQPKKERPEFGKGSKYDYNFSDEWTLVEWFVDHATQTYRLYINGAEIADASFSKGAGEFAGAEIPAVFESLSFGWNNYQGAGAGFTAWIDDIALSKERIGAQGIATATTAQR